MSQLSLNPLSLPSGPSWKPHVEQLAFRALHTAWRDGGQGKHHSLCSQGLVPKGIQKPIKAISLYSRF